MRFFGKDKDKEEVKEMPVKQTGSLKERLDRINNCLLYTSPSPRD